MIRKKSCSPRTLQVVSKTDSTCGTVTHYEPCNGVGDAATVTSPPTCRSTSRTSMTSTISPTITASATTTPQTTITPIPPSSTAPPAPVVTVCSIVSVESKSKQLVPRLTTHSLGDQGTTACSCTPGGETVMSLGETCGTSTYLPSQPCPTA